MSEEPSHCSRLMMAWLSATSKLSFSTLPSASGRDLGRGVTGVPSPWDGEGGTHTTESAVLRPSMQGGLPGAQPSSPPAGWVAHPNPSPTLLSPPSLPRRCPCPHPHPSTPCSPHPVSVHTGWQNPVPAPGQRPQDLSDRVCVHVRARARAHLRRRTEEVNPDRSPLLICVLGTPQGPDGGDTGLSQAFRCASLPPSSHGDPGTLGTPNKAPPRALHRAGKAQDALTWCTFSWCAQR